MSTPRTQIDLGPGQHHEAKALGLDQFLHDALDGMDAPADERSRAALGCLFASLDHFSGLALLFGSGLYAPAFALIRPLYEGFVRGTWFGFCSTDQQVSDFLSGKEPPKILVLIEAIESSSPFGDNTILSTAHKRNWNALNGFTHNGVQQVLLSNSPGEISRVCSSEKLREALTYSGSVAILAAIAMCAVAGRDETAAAILKDAPRFVAIN